MLGMEKEVSYNYVSPIWGANIQSYRAELSACTYEPCGI